MYSYKLTKMHYNYFKKIKLSMFLNVNFERYGRFENEYNDLFIYISIQFFNVALNSGCLHQARRHYYYSKKDLTNLFHLGKHLVNLV